MDVPDKSHDKLGLSITGSRVNNTCAGIERMVLGSIRVQLQGVCLSVMGNPHGIRKFDPAITTLEAATTWLQNQNPKTCPPSEFGEFFFAGVVPRCVDAQFPV